jgi:uroporphyrinogen decarboxylase
MLKPLHARLLQTIRTHSPAKVFFHSDGDVLPLIDDLVDIGVDILNPIQTSAGRMADLIGLKQRYGKALCFCGAIDSQHVLPLGSPQDVKNEVKRVCEVLGPGGGYLLASVHTITNDVPPANVLALAQAVQEHGRYPLQQS